MTGPLERDCPEVKGEWPFIGSALPVLRDFFGFLDSLRPCPDIVRFSVFGHPVYLLNRPGFIEELLVSSRGNFVKGPAVRYAERVLGKGLLTLDGTGHRRHRAKLIPAFHRQALARYAAAMTREASIVSGEWREGAAVDMYGEMLRLTLNIALRTLLGMTDPGEIAWIHRDFNLFLTEFSPRRFLFPKISALRERFPIGKERRIWEARDRLDEAIRRLIAEQRRDPAREGIIGMMMEAGSGRGGESFTEDEIRDEVVTLLGAGHATTSLGLAFCWYHLARNPEVRRKLDEELRALGTREPGPEDLPRLGYLRMVLKETLRLMPPIFFIGLVAVKEHRFGGCVVPGGSVVAVSQYVTHRDERYFPDPLRFWPERWDGREPGETGFAYFPFSAGPRGCIGEGFAWMEMALAIAVLARDWNPRLPEGFQMKLQPSITMHLPEGLPMVLERAPG